MNVVLLADKKLRKPFETAVKNDPNINLVGVETLIRGNTVVRIADHHNPHILVVYRNVPIKEGITVKDLISFLRVKKPSMRIIYVYGSITDNADFIREAEYFLENGIIDIIRDETPETVTSVIDSPMTREDVESLIEELRSNEKEDTPSEKEEVSAGSSIVYDPLHIDFPSVTALDEFDIDRVVYQTAETMEEEHLKIGVAQLQHHNGCTHTSLELAAVLSKKKSTAVIIDGDTFRNICVFHKIDPQSVKSGINIQGIDVFPYDMRNMVAADYSILIYDIGYLSDETKLTFDKCDLKLMLCSSAEWDISKTSNFIKYGDPAYIHSITFLFPRVSQTKFIKYNKAFVKSGITAYRLHNSPDWTNPHSGNVDVYNHIIENCIIKDTATVKNRRKLFKLKLKTT